MIRIFTRAALLAVAAAGVLALPSIAPAQTATMPTAASPGLAVLPAPEATKLFRHGDPVGRAAVDASGRTLGTIDYVLADPLTNEVTHALVGGPGTGNRYVAVPVGLMRERGQQVQIDMLPNDLAAAPRFTRDEIESRYPRHAAAAGATGGGSTFAASGLGGLGTAGAPGSRVGDPELAFYRGLLGPKDYTPTGIAVLQNQGELIGRRVVDAGGQPVGTISRVLADPETTKPRFAIIETGGSFVAAPVTALSTSGNQVVINATVETLARAPRYTMSQLERDFQPSR